MYCKHCGKEIDDNSSFCKHCGKPQNGNNKAFKINMSKGWIIYLVWAFINLYLLMGRTYYDCSRYFYPFTKRYFDDDYGNWQIGYYDLSEFIVYVFIIPAVLYLVYRLFHTKIDNFINKILKK